MIEILFPAVDCANRCWKATGTVERALESDFSDLTAVLAPPTTTCVSLAKELDPQGLHSLFLK